MNSVWDPLRKKNVAATPEETVRQWFIGVLQREMKVPAHMMMSECGFRYGGKRYRADIVVFGRDARPLAVVECKRPEVDTGADVAQQALRYNAVLDVRWIIITNGKSTKIFRRTGDEFSAFASLPEYDTMQDI